LEDVKADDKEIEPQPEGLRLTVDTGVLLLQATGPIELTVQAIAFGLAAAEQADPISTNAVGQILQLGDHEPAQIKSHFLELVPRVAVNSLWQDFRLFLDQFAVVASLYARQKDVRGEWSQSQVLKKAGRLPLYQLLMQIERDLERDLPEELKVQITSLNKARNCIEHRKGRVGEQDRNIGSIGESPALELTWKAPYAHITGNQEPIRVSQAPELIIPPLGEMRVILEPQVKCWPLAELLEFEPYEIIEVGLSLVFLAQALTNVLSKMAPIRKIRSESE
jgi:hypothetical protein